MSDAMVSREKCRIFTGRTWIEVQKNYKTINTEVEEKQSDSILNFYKKLIQLRKKLPVIANGTIYSDGKVDGTLRPYECKVMRSI